MDVSEGILKTLVLTVFALGVLACSSTPVPLDETPSGLTSDPREQQSGLEPERQPAPPRRYRILKEGRHKQDNWLELNEYFLIHHLYADIFHRFGLYSFFTLEDKIRIFAALLYNLDFQSPVNLVIDNFSDDGSLIASLQLIRIGKQSGVLLATNTNREGTKIYAGMENVAKTYKRAYLIVGDQLIALMDLYSERRESELIEKNSADGLARFYIFDGNKNNDTVAEGLLIGSIREAENPLERIRPEIILTRYYMSRYRLVEAQALLIEIGNQLSRIGGDDDLRESYAIAYEELLITNALKEHEERMRESRPKPL